MHHIGIITFLHNENYGSILQAWALQQALRKLGQDAIHLDYCPDTKEKIRNMIVSMNSPKLLLDSFGKKKTKSNHKEAADKKAAFDRFRCEQLTVSAPSHNAGMLRQAAKDCDMLLSGSDQIWSPVWMNPVYYLNFASQSQHCVSYAASLGVSRIANPVKARRISRLLSKYEHISVREEEGASALKSSCGVEAAVLPDPIFLPQRSDWEQLAVPPKKDKPYMACYFIGNRQAYWETVRHQAESRGLDVVVIPVTEEAYDSGYELAAGISPEEFIGYVMHADYAVTDSFHGAAFSSLFGTPFELIRRYAENDPESKNSRIDQLMRSLGMQSGEDCTKEHVRCQLDRLRQEGLDYLRKAVETD